MSLELISLSAFFFSIVNIAINRTLGNRKRLDEIRKTINIYQKESTDAMKRKDEKKLKDLEGRQEELLKMTNEMLMLQFKPLLVVLPIFYLTSGWVKSTYASFVITLPLSLPVPTGFSIVWRNVFGPFGWFVICVMLTGIIFEIALSLIKKR